MLLRIVNSGYFTRYMSNAPFQRLAVKVRTRFPFPVSSGQQHVALSWVPLSPTSPDNEPKSDTDKRNVAADRTPRTDLPRPHPPKASVRSAIAQRISSKRHLQEDQQDARAQLALEVRPHETGDNRSNLLTFHKCL